MALPSANPFPLTGDDAIDASTNGSFWQLGPDRTLRWSISDGFAGEFFTSPAATQQYFGAALSWFSYYANIKFTYVGYFHDPIIAFQNSSDINLAPDALNFASSIWAVGFFPATSNNIYLGQPGDIFLNVNSAANFLPSYDPGSAGWALMLHEIGHTLGLKHTHDDGGTGRPTLVQLGLGDFDIDWVSVMSYRDNLDFDVWHFDPATPLLLDVIGLQYLYGANRQTNATNSVYDLSATGFYSTIWDAGGIDQVDASGEPSGWLIQLPYTQVSNLVTEYFGFAAPIADLASSSPLSLVWLEGNIENAVGSSHADTIYGNYLNNRLTGGLGNDELDGNGGFDVAVFSGVRAQYAITQTASSYVVSGPDGIDTLTRVEKLEFADGFVDLAAPAPSSSAEIVQTVYSGVLRTTPSPQQAASDVLRLDAGLSLDSYVDEVVERAATSTIPALVVYGFLLDATPDSSKLDGLAAFAQIQYNAYAAKGVAGPHIGPYEALGLGFSGEQAFLSRFGLLTDNAFIANAYQDSFGRSANGAQQAHFQSQLDYFESLYIGAGVDTGSAALRAKGAVVGQMLGFAAIEFENDLASAARTFLVDAADGQVAYGSSLLGMWG